MLDHCSIGYLELDTKIDTDIITQFILDGRVDNNLLVIIRNFQSQEICEKLKDRFEYLIAQAGSDRGEDGFVRTQQIGSSQFHKNGMDYIRDTIHNAGRVLDLFSVLEPSVVANLFLDNELEMAFARKGLVYRPARHLTGTANFATTRKWLNNGAMALHPHDDGAQLAFAAEDNFEVAEGTQTIAANFCIADDESGSELVLWNLKPDQAVRRSHGIEDTGYPYPLDFMNGFDSLRVKVNAGDLYFMNASFVHGVENGATNFRITSGRFITTVGDKVLYWT